MNPLILENVVKCFHQGGREVRALDGLSVVVEPGEFLAVMGQSGSGKSTLLHLAAGLTPADGGTVRVAGEDLARMTDRQLTLFRRRRIGLVFQSFNLIPTLTAEENVALPLMLEGRRAGRGRETGRAGDGQRTDEAARDRVTPPLPFSPSPRAHVNGPLGRKLPLEAARELLVRLNLGHRLGHRPDAMSGGEQQRVAIARALVTDPALILADEPTGNLDSENGRLVCELLADLSKREGRTVVLVTHEPSVAAYAGRVLILRDGRAIDAFEVTSRDEAEVARRYHTAR